MLEGRASTDSLSLTRPARAPLALDVPGFPAIWLDGIETALKDYSGRAPVSIQRGPRRRVVTIARSLGALGEEIAIGVAKSLGYALVDQEIIVRAAEQAGVPPEAVAETERRRSLLWWLVEAVAVSDPEGARWDPTWDLPGPPCAPYKSFIRDAIQEQAAKGNVVIVGHGAGIVLAAMESCLRVLVTGSKEERAARLGPDRKSARKAIEASDKETSDFLRRSYGVCKESAVDHDLVINTDHVCVAEATRTIVAAVEEAAEKGSPAIG